MYHIINYYYIIICKFISYQFLHHYMRNVVYYLDNKYQQSQKIISFFLFMQIKMTYEYCLNMKK
ncbi:hypothetical protein pb186bvf_009128 [Paramecium bursaria]